jgi:hypothetical protein
VDTVVDDAWISPDDAPNLVDRCPCAARARRAIIWAARRGRGNRIAGPPQGGRAHRKVSRAHRKMGHLSQGRHVIHWLSRRRQR